MDRNHWYNHQNYTPRQDHHTSRSPQVPANRVAADSVQDAQRLLAVYPMASATPSDYTARHLDTQSINATAPSYIHPQYYTMNGASYSHNQGNPSPYGQYAHEVDYLSQQRQPNDSGYWENARNDVVGYLGDQSGSSSSNYVPPTHWTPPTPTSTLSSYQTNAFTQSVFQRTAPSSLYPTPPPPGITTTSSSLAFALGAPPPRPQSQNDSQFSLPQQPQQQIHKPEESAQFFNQFLEQKSRQINHTPLHDNGSQVQDSPDPLVLAPGNGLPTTDVTPRKRKLGTHAETPSVKRVNSNSVLKTPGSLLTPMTPSSSRSQFETSKSTKKVVLMPYIELPVTPTSSQSQPQRSISSGIKKSQPYIDVPVLPKSYFTPSRSVSSKSVGSLSRKLEGNMKVDDTPDDLGGYGSVDDEFSPTRGHGYSSVKSSARRTGDRDDRAPLEKLTSLIEDIFEAEDALPADIASTDLPVEWFSPTSTDGASPLLHPNRIRKLAKYIGQITRPTKRIRLSESTMGSGGTPKGKGRITEVDIGILGRILKILERSVKSGEDLDPFHYMAVTREKSASPRKKKPAKRPKADVDEDAEGEEPEVTDVVVEEPVAPPPEITESDLESLTRLLNVAKDSVLAADCCIALLGSDRLNKQLYSEELITTCLSTIKNQLTKVVYPFVEASYLGNSQLSPLLQHLHKNITPDIRENRRQLSEIFQALTSVMPRIANLVCAGMVMMSDSIIIQTVYIGIGPFFVVESGVEGDSKSKKQNVVLSTLGNSAMRGLRLDALSLIRNVFANHVDQRSWIIEEILSSLIKLSDTNRKAGQFRLRDGRSIRTVSALLLQLVQTSAHDVRLAAGRISKSRQQAFALRRQDSNTDLADEPFLEEQDFEEIRLYSSGLESARTAAKTIIVFLTQRSGKGKTTKTSNEAEYRTIFDNLISDLLVVLFWPEWPAASLILGIVCKFMVSSLDDVKTSNQVENNAAKSIALDHLGVIAARIRTSTLKFKSQGRNATESAPLKPMEEIVSALNPKEFEKLLAVHQDIASHLCKRSSEDQAYDSARELTAATWGQELAFALKQANIWIENPEGEMELKANHRRALEFGKNVRIALREVWTDPATDVFDIGSQDDVVRVDRFAEEIGSIQSLKSSFQPILNVILQALDAPPVFMRTKALRALGQIVTSDPTVLSSPNVRHAIETHLLDSSPAVRDAAVELIGKYMIDSSEVAGDYYQKIAERIADTGVGVRKRVIKLLKSFYNVTDDVSRRVDVCTKLVLRMLDEDDTVKELAIKTVEELWFQSTPPLVSVLKGKTPIVNNPSDKAPLLAKVTVIMGVASNFKDRQSPLEDLLHKIIADKDGDTSSLRAGYSAICETLIDGLVDASDLPGFTVTNCVRTIHLFTSAYPAFLSGPNASTLLPYLKNATTSEEQATSDYLLKIFRACIPHMPKTATKFGNELQLALQPMIIKPSSAGGVHALQETVACLCTVVRCLTHDFSRLVALVKSCNARLQQAITRPVAQQMNPIEVKTLSVLIFIVSLLAEHCNFDRLRLEHETLAADLNSITKDSIIEHIYISLLRLYQKHTEAALRGRILQCLGFLFRAQPSLMTLDSSATIMDAIFSSTDEESRGRLLRIMQEFLVSEAAKHTAKEKENPKNKTKGGDVNMEELVGNTDGFADSGVSSAIVQRYLGPILEAALSQHVQIQAVAIDILSFTVKQGLAHPLQSFPVIVALETSANTGLSSRASALHAILHSKHMSLLNTRYIVSAKASFDYQKKLYGNDVHGYRMQPIQTALLQRWYSLVRERRASRQDFLKALVKVFDVNSSLKSSQEDVDFTRYMTENFSAFDYKTLEEVLTVIKYLTSVLSTTGMQLVEILSPSNLLAQLHGIAEPSANPIEPPQPAESGLSTSPTQAQDNVEIMRTSIIVAMIMLLKANLKSTYGLSEEKCSKFVIGKKSAAGDKPAVKRYEKPISWERLPFAKVPLLTSENLSIQKTTFLDVWNEDGLAAEPKDDDFA